MQQVLIADWEGALLRRWSIVPVLACAGFMSGAYTMLFTVLAAGSPTSISLHSLEASHSG